MVKVTLFRQKRAQMNTKFPQSSLLEIQKERYPPDIKRLSRKDNKHK